MALQQRKGILSFWDAVLEFFMDLFGWFKSMFEKVLEKIRDGCRNVKEAIKVLFSMVRDIIIWIF
jgi:hypothetical protein